MKIEPKIIRWVGTEALEDEVTVGGGGSYQAITAI